MEGRTDSRAQGTMEGKHFNPMSKVSEKYNIPIETVKQLVKDGLFSCSLPMKEEVFERYTELRRSGSSMEAIYSTISKEKGIPDSTVRHYIYAMKNL